MSQFKIIKEVKTPNYFHKKNQTLHLSTERYDRIKEYHFVFGVGNPVHSFIVDKSHINGLEVHVLCSNRLIYIYNKTSKKLVTVLYARDGQLKRYFTRYNRYPKHKFSEYHQGYNKI